MTDNAPEIRRMNVRAVRASIDFFKYLTVRGGRLIRNGNRYTLEVSGSGRVGGRWSGRVYFGGSLVLDTNPGEWQGEFVRVYLVNGSCAPINGTLNEETGKTDPPDENLDVMEYYHVANLVRDENGDPVFVSPGVKQYALNSNTCGDIRCRIT
jgi:hypothetical protein